MLRAPVGCAIAPSGTVAVADAAGEVIGLSASDGRVLWRTSTVGGEAMASPSAVAFMGDGSFLVADSRRGRLDRFSQAGEWIGPFAPEAAVGLPTAIATGEWGTPATGIAAVIDASTGAIIVLSTLGVELARIDTATHAAGAATALAPSGLAFIGHGLLAVTARTQSKVIILDLGDGSGKARPRVVGSWGGRGAFPGFFNSPQGLASAGGWIFVADQFNHRVARHDAAGKGQLAYGQHAVQPRGGEGAVHYPVAVAVAASVSMGAKSGPLAVVCEPFERRVQAYSVELGPEPADLRLVLPKLEGVQSHFGAAASRDGQRLFLQDPESCSVVVFDLSRGQPIHVTSIGSSGTKPHEFGSIDAMLALDGGLRLLVADGVNRRLALWQLTEPPKDLIFEPFMAKLVKTRPYDRLGLPEGASIVGLTHAPTGEILALSESGPTVVTLDESLRTASTAPLPLPDTLARPSAIAADSSGTVAVLIDDPAAVATFTRTAAGWTPAGVRPLMGVLRARAIAAAGDGRWLVVDDWGDAVIELLSDGSQRLVGSRGVADGEFWLPSALAVGPGGDVYVVDSGNHRAQRFDPKLVWEMTFSLGRTYTRARTADDVLRVRTRKPAPPPPAAPPAQGGPS